MTEEKTGTDTAEALKAEAAAARSKASWRENDQRLIWCGSNPDGSFTFRNTVAAFNKGPKIGEAEVNRLLGAEGPWMRPVAATSGDAPKLCRKGSTHG